LNKKHRGLFDFYKKEGLREESFGLDKQIRVDYLLKFLGEGKLLDVGCAQGLYLTPLSAQKRLTQMVGIEISRPKLLEALKKKRNRKADFVNASWDNLPFKEKAFETVIWSHGPEHAIDVKRTLEEIRRVVKKRLIVTCPISTPILLLEENLETRINLLLLKTIGTPFRGHLHTFTYNKIEKLLSDSDFEIAYGNHNIPSMAIHKQIQLVLQSIVRVLTKMTPHAKVSEGETPLCSCIFVLTRLMRPTSLSLQRKTILHARRCYEGEKMRS